jgi:hypothetical protein
VAGSVGGEGFEEVADLGVGQGMGDVCQCHHADETVTVDDGQTPAGVG